MRNELFTNKLGRPANNKVLVEVTDIFDSIITKLGIELPNMALEETWGDSPGYSFSEFIIRYGRVVSVPAFITHGSFDYETENELQEGDIVYWNIVAFRDSQPLVKGDRKYLLVDYHEIMLRIRNEVITPINGYCLFTAISEEHKYREFTNIINKTEKWKIWKKPEKLNKELNPRFWIEDIWEVGETVYLQVMDKPFKIEGDIVKNLPEELYAAPYRMILCEV